MHINEPNLLKRCQFKTVTRSTLIEFLSLMFVVIRSFCKDEIEIDFQQIEGLEKRLLCAPS